MSCYVSVCDAVTAVENGGIGYDPDKPYGDSNQRFEGVTATVTCNANYGLDGPEASICASGQWTEANLGPCLPGMTLICMLQCMLYYPS